MRAHQDRRRGAGDGQGAARRSTLRLATTFTGFAQDATASPPSVIDAGGETRAYPRPLSRQRRRRAQHRAQGARHRFRGLHLCRPHPQHRGGLRFQAAWLCPPQLHLRSGGMVEPVPLERPARALAGAFSDRARGRSGRADEARSAPGAPSALPRRPAAISRSSAPIFMSCISAWRRASGRAAPSSPATPRT